MYTILLSLNNDSFASSFPVRMPFIFSSYLIAVVKSSSTMLNKSGESGHPCLAPDLKGKAYSFCPLSMMLVVDLLYMTFIMLRYAPSLPTLLSIFITNGCWISLNAFSASVYMIM